MPKRASISHHAASVPGTPTERRPTLFSRPSASMYSGHVSERGRYMSGRAAAGATV